MPPSPNPGDRGHFVIWPTNINNLLASNRIEALDRPKISKQEYLNRLNEMGYKWQVDL